MHVFQTICLVTILTTLIRSFQASKLGGVDILVSNAAVNPQYGPILESTEKVWDKIFEVNVKAAYLLSQEAVPFFRNKKGGNIVFISSIAAYMSPQLPVLGIYGVTKTALLGLTKALSIELASQNIRVNCVAPGVIRSKFGEYITNNEKLLKSIMDTTPIRRVGEPDEVSGAVAFLVSDEASYITGETILVAGGGPSRL